MFAQRIVERSTAKNSIILKNEVKKKNILSSLSSKENATRLGGNLAVQDAGKFFADP